MNGIPWVSTQLFYLKSIGNMPLIFCECALHQFCRRPTNWTLLIVVITKFISAPKLWLACTIFSAIILLHLQTQSSKNYSLISLPVFSLKSLITLLMNTPRMKNQSVLTTLPFLHSIRTIQPTFLKNLSFSLFLIFFYANPDFLPLSQTKDSKKGADGRERPTTQKEGSRP